MTDPTPARLTKEELDYAEVCLTELGEAAGLRPRLVFAELRAHRAAESACRPYLREGETASEGLARLTEDAASSTRIGKGAATLYAQEMQRAERLAAELRQAESALQQARALAADRADAMTKLSQLATYYQRGRDDAQARIAALEQERDGLLRREFAPSVLMVCRKCRAQFVASPGREACPWCRVAALEDAQRWRPMDTAPKDRTVLVFWREHGAAYWGCGAWFEGKDGSCGWVGSSFYAQPQGNWTTLMSPFHWAEMLPPGPTRAEPQP